MIEIPTEYVEKIKNELAKLPPGETETERRLEAALDFLLSGDSLRALTLLQRLNAFNCAVPRIPFK